MSPGGALGGADQRMPSRVSPRRIDSLDACGMLDSLIRGTCREGRQMERFA